MASTVEKSYETSNKLIGYMSKISTASFSSLQQQLQECTLATTGEDSGMIGAPEVLEMGKAMIHLTRATKVLDIGTFTGASALAWAIELPENGKVISMDVSHEWLNKVGLPLIESAPALRDKIDFRLGSAVEILQSLIDSGATGSFGFAFIDADKGNYSRYYELCMQLMAPGGALWDGAVVDPKEPSAVAIDAVNRLAAADSRVYNTLLNVGDGVHLIVKKH
ncbi:hypothetical protein PRIPAC_72858 [Pristionchus pacificus]|uniref:Methyltransferase n=1 Tax=Pristionchus pacificus TaxID=54126 RepID=A0A2A6B5B5_PRIPA|nr:hypothetical protein PRIPAC_72858 [Pristionchus pacificus]|eukprot:PDM61051.1 methyltransferase [Pristionchus pacificus]